MKGITREMIKEYKINKIKYDFMGYTFNRYEDLSFHHLIIPHRDCKDLGYGEGFYKWNGAILNQSTSHDYLHVIERVDREKFIEITKILIEENRLGELNIEQLRQIRQILLQFENEYKHETNSKGKLLIKRKYITDRIDL